MASREPKEPTKQFKLKVKLPLWEQLDTASREYQRESANMVAVEIVRRYFPLWVDLAEADERFFRQQCENAKLTHTPTESTEVLQFEKRAKKPTVKAKPKRKLSG